MNNTPQPKTTGKLKNVTTLLLLSAGLFFASFGANLSAGVSLGQLSGLTPSDSFSVPEPAAPATVQPPLKAVAPLNAYFISVGQGDAEYIELPNGDNVLIDGGPYPNAGLVNFINEHHITHIDHVVLTHPHLDHYAGLIYVFNNLKVDNFYDTREENTDASSSRKLRDKIKELGVNIVYPEEGDNLNWDRNVQVKVLNTCSEPGGSNSGPVLNDCSIVLKVTYQNTSILYMGDLESDQEARLITTYGSQLKSDVLKIGHHGSPTATSPAFLNMVKPQYAYLEVGEGNTFGFPAPVTLSNLYAAGVTLFRTDMDGTLQYRIGGQ